jgi:hypothetical protein
MNFGDSPENADPARVRDLLQRRVDAYSDEVNDKMMRMLDRLLTLRESVDQVATSPPSTR